MENQTVKAKKHRFFTYTVGFFAIFGSKLPAMTTGGTTTKRFQQLAQRKV